MEALRSEGVELILNERVTEVTDTHVNLKSGRSVPYGLCVWSAGNAARPLVRDIVASIPEQARFQRPNPDLTKLAVVRLPPPRLAPGQARLPLRPSRLRHRIRPHRRRRIPTCG